MITVRDLVDLDARKQRYPLEQGAREEKSETKERGRERERGGERCSNEIQVRDRNSLTETLLLLQCGIVAVTCDSILFDMK